MANNKKYSIYAWNRPYDNPNIQTVYTGLKGIFKTSPIFGDCVADIRIELTGYRKQDYKKAEKAAGIKHIPKVTVWHHAWDEIDGQYRMQLVDFAEHKQTCPHAGGCKLWSIKNKRPYRNAITYVKAGNYTDISCIYPINEIEKNYFQQGYVSKRILAIIRRKRASLIGMDVYGNLIYKKGKMRYFWDHEQDLLFPIENGTKINI